VRGLLGVAPSVVLLLALVSATATAGEIPYSQSAAVVSRDGEVLVDPVGVSLVWHPAVAPGTLVDHRVSGGPQWWSRWFGNDPLVLTRQDWAHNDLIVAPADAPDEFDLMADCDGTSLDRRSTPPRPVLVDSADAIALNQTFLQPIEEIFTANHGRAVWLFDFNPKRGSIDFRRLAPGRSTPIRVPAKTRSKCVPELAVLVLLAFGALLFIPLRRRRVCGQAATESDSAAAQPPSPPRYGTKPTGLESRLASRPCIPPLDQLFLARQHRTERKR
jgi:hypothetical protein